MKYAISVLLVSWLCFLNCNAQKVYAVAKFSDKYSAKVFVPEEYDEDDYESVVYVSIYDEEKELIKDTVQIDISYELDGKDVIASNVLEIPYGEQSLIIYDDFNCDGKDDLAVKIGNFSCYGGPAYNVYTSVDGGLKLDEELSELAQNYCGFFEYDCSAKEIRTMTKSGCCWHQYATYDISSGKPIPKEEVVEDVMFASYPIRAVKLWTEGKETMKTYPLADHSEYVFSFELVKNKKKVLVFDNLRGTLFYCFLKEDGTVEFDFGEDFYLSQDGAKDILTFSNADATHSIYSSDDEVGIIVSTKGKTYNMKGIPATREGSLKTLHTIELSHNLHIK